MSSLIQTGIARLLTLGCAEKTLLLEEQLGRSVVLQTTSLRRWAWPVIMGGAWFLITWQSCDSLKLFIMIVDHTREEIYLLCRFLVLRCSLLRDDHWTGKNVISMAMVIMATFMATTLAFLVSIWGWRWRRTLRLHSELRDPILSFPRPQHGRLPAEGKPHFSLVTVSMATSCIIVLTQLLERDPSNRLGCIEDREPIRSHLFFREIDWNLLERRKLRPPYKPAVVSMTTTASGLLANYSRCSCAAGVKWLMVS